ncbi:MAG TPA: tRNA-(ms[2]io[6]A)-hydroxylase [Planctomycetes bacterium]|nr:tRNA-(ms[2]io[6]A)-hydroxylase [Planctomycetota bacterium]
MRPTLRWKTPTAWAAAVLADPLALLADHAHCEMGAASTAQTLIARHPGEPILVDALAALASEELRHFRRVHRLLAELGGELPPIGQNPYAGALVRAVDRKSPTALFDRLIVSALIEERSHERFEMLAAACFQDAASRCGEEEANVSEMIGKLFSDLLSSEAGHARLFLDLAERLFPEEDLAARLASWEEREAEGIRSLAFSYRVHSGPPESVPGPQGWGTA